MKHIHLLEVVVVKFLEHKTRHCCAVSIITRKKEVSQSLWWLADGTGAVGADCSAGQAAMLLVNTDTAR